MIRACWCLAALLWTGTLCPAQETTEIAPNVVLILTDDQGYGDYGFQGNPALLTPSLDRLARESVVLPRFYVHPVCAPTRACLMTGRYNYRTRALDTYIGRAMMDPSEVTLAEVLRKAGYATGIFGKWHLGDCYPLRAMDQGFSESLVIRGGGIAQPSDPRGGEGAYTDPILFHNGEQTKASGYCTDVFFQAAKEFMTRAKTAHTPFFAYIPTNAPHAPLNDIPKDRYEQIRKRDLVAALVSPESNPEKREQQQDRLARTFAMIENIDQNVGELLVFLDKEDLARNTLVIYLGDNGADSSRYSAGLRGSKSSVYEGGVRTPLLVRWPGRLRPAIRDQGFGAHIDLLPTLAAAAGVTLPDNLVLDGVNLMGLLSEGRASPRSSLVIQSHRGDVPARRHHFAVIEDQWKLVRHSGFGRETPEESAPYQLFDLKRDPSESTDVLAKHPETYTRLLARYDEWFADVSNTRPDNYAPPRIVIGAREEPLTTLSRQDWRHETGRPWGPRSNGRWLLRAQEAGIYQVTVELRKAAEEDTPLRLELPGRREIMTVPAGSFSVTRHALALSEGDQWMRAVDLRDGAGPWQVHVSRPAR